MTKCPSTAFVLAAGLGTRMRPLTDRVPKPMVPLAGRPLIDHVLDRLAAAGVGSAVINVHYLAEVLIAHLARRQQPFVTISDERGQLLETGGGVARAMATGLIGSEPFFVHNSDTVWLEQASSNLTRLSRTWDDRRMDSLLLLARRDNSIGYDGRGDFHVEADSRLRRRTGDEAAAFVFAGVSIAHPRLFDGAPAGPFSLNLLWDRALAERRLFGIVLDGTWMHVGTPEALADAERLIGTEDQA